jgi:hypothetical protein
MKTGGLPWLLMQLGDRFIYPPGVPHILQPITLICKKWAEKLSTTG